MSRSPRLALTALVSGLLVSLAWGQWQVRPPPQQHSRRGPASPPLPGGTVSPDSGRENLGPGTVVSLQKISNEAGGFPDTLDDEDSFGSSVAALGDLDGDGIGELAVGSPR